MIIKGVQMNSVYEYRSEGVRPYMLTGVQMFLADIRIRSHARTLDARSVHFCTLYRWAKRNPGECLSTGVRSFSVNQCSRIVVVLFDVHMITFYRSPAGNGRPYSLVLAVLAYRWIVVQFLNLFWCTFDQSRDFDFIAVPTSSGRKGTWDVHWTFFHFEQSRTRKWFAERLYSYSLVLFGNDPKFTVHPFLQLFIIPS